MIQAFGGSTPAEIDSTDVGVLEQLQLGPVLDSPSRTNSFRNMFNTLKKRSNALEGNLPQFPSLVIRRNALEPQGSFAEAQAQFLQPDMATVSRLASTFRQKKIGVVAHFYMDPEVQGVLSSAADSWPHIHISGLLFRSSYTELSCLAASLHVVSRRMAIPTALLAALFAFFRTRLHSAIHHSCLTPSIPHFNTTQRPSVRSFLCNGVSTAS